MTLTFDFIHVGTGNATATHPHLAADPAHDFQPRVATHAHRFRVAQDPCLTKFQSVAMGNQRW